MKKTKTKGIKNLLALLGEDPNGHAPRNLAEARQMHEESGGESPDRSHGHRLDNDCGKVCFTSESSCRAAINYRLKKGSNVSKLRSYLCPDCSAWHMTSSFHS